MRKLILLTSLCSVLNIGFSQPDSIQSAKVDRKEIQQAKEQGETIEFERPFNFFAAAGVTYRLSELYNVAISPIDYTVQFQQVSPLGSGISTGLVWNPFWGNYRITTYKDNKPEVTYETKRTPFAVSLLVNVADISFSSAQPINVSPIDVGFGLGYRKDNFLVLATVEFSALRQPRDYFINAYKDQNKTLILAGSEEPVRTIGTEDNSLFITRLYPAVGIKIAYTFSKNKEE